MRIAFPACVIGLGSASTWAVASLLLGTSGPDIPSAWPFHGPGGPSTGQALQARVSVGHGKGVIRGRVLDAKTGRPVSRVRIWVQSEDGRQSWEAETAGEGTWGIAGLSESAYFVGAHKPDYQPVFGGSPLIVLSNRRLERTVELKLSHGTGFGGRVTVDGRPAADVEIRVLRVTKGAEGPSFQFEGGLTRTDETGRYRLAGLRTGQYVLAALGDRYTARRSGQAAVTTFYPGTLSANEARRFDVMEGTVINDLRIALKSLPTVRVSGQVVSSTGAPVDAIVSYSRRDHPFFGHSSSGYGPQGGSRFSLPPLTAGRYRVTARPAHGIGRSEAASQDITVGDTDISGLELRTVPAAIIRGRLVASRQYDAWNLAWMRITAMPEDIREGSEAELSVVSSDRTFEIQTHHFPARVVAIQPTGGWEVGTLRWQGREAVDGVLPVSPGATISGVEVVLRRRTSVVEGTVTNPTDCTWVVVLQRRKDGAPTCIASTALRDGEFRTMPLPAGEYRIAATDASPAIPLSPARLWDDARPLTLDDDKTVTLTLTARPRP